MKLKRRKVGDQKYEMVDTATGEVIAIVFKSGSHLDDYPWDWYLADGIAYADPKPRSTGVEESMKYCVDAVESYANQYGLADEVRVSAYDLRPGDWFILDRTTYIALATPTGEFNAYVKARNTRTGTEGDIVIDHGVMLKVARPRKAAQ